MDNDKLPLEAIYRQRFEVDINFRQQMWQTLCSEFFQKHIHPGSTVLELGAGYCEFINNIEASRKIAVDLNQDTRHYAKEGVEVHICSSTDLSSISSNSIDAVFVSNFFEHLTRNDIISTLHEAHRVLKQKGKLIILQPNYRFCIKDYWMFFDHITPIDDRSLVEVLEANGYQINLVIPRFLPYTTKSALPKSIALVRLYLNWPILWNFFGAQCFVVVSKQ